MKLWTFLLHDWLHFWWEDRGRKWWQNMRRRRRCAGIAMMNTRELEEEHTHTHKRFRCEWRKCQKWLLKEKCEWKRKECNTTNRCQLNIRWWVLGGTAICCLNGWNVEWMNEWFALEYLYPSSVHVSPFPPHSPTCCRPSICTNTPTLVLFERRRRWMAPCNFSNQSDFSRSQLEIHQKQQWMNGRAIIEWMKKFMFFVFVQFVQIQKEKLRENATTATINTAFQHKKACNFLGFPHFP